MEINKRRMNILWISNVIFPEACEHLNITPPVVGGWMKSGADGLIEYSKNCKLTVISFLNNIETPILINEYSIKYIILPKENIEKNFKDINNTLKPDIVHIHGTEYQHSLKWIQTCGNINVVVSIQGLVSEYSKYYLGGIKKIVLIKNTTIRDIIRNDSIFHQKKKMNKRGTYEIELIKNTKNVICRTRWDKSSVWAINKEIQIFHCDETLRSNFYNCNWKYDTCKKNSIFISQAHYPIKGFHKLIESLPIIIREFPDTHIYVAGINFTEIAWYRRNCYSNIINRYINKNNLNKHISFLGILKEQEMINQYENANVFVCPSAIENSPNSVGEAQLIGTPCVASYVGGSMDMIEDNKTGLLYRYNDTNLLAKRICEIFSNADLCKTLSKNGSYIASKRHDKNNNAKTLFDIYERIIYKYNNAQSHSNDQFV